MVIYGSRTGFKGDRCGHNSCGGVSGACEKRQGRTGDISIYHRYYYNSAYGGGKVRRAVQYNTRRIRAVNILSVAALCAVLCGVVLFIRSFDGNIARLLTAVLCVFIGSAVYSSLREPVEYIKETAQATALGEYMPYILKSVAICFVCKLCKDICDSFGEATVGSSVDMAGKVSVIVVCIPLIKQILSMAMGYLN